MNGCNTGNEIKPPELTGTDGFYEGEILEKLRVNSCKKTYDVNQSPDKDISYASVLLFSSGQVKQLFPKSESNEDGFTTNFDSLVPGKGELVFTYTNSSGQSISSDPVTIFKSGYSLHDKLKIEEDYIGTAGPAGNGIVYVSLGDMPQSILPFDSDLELSPEPSDKGYYIGADGNYYELCKFNENSGYGARSVFTTTNREKWYFKIEPLYWRLIQNGWNPGSTKLDFAYLLGEKIYIGGIPYSGGSIFKDYIYIDEQRYSGIGYWPYSRIRAYLNGKSFYTSTSDGTRTKYEDTRYSIDPKSNFLYRYFSESARGYLASDFGLKYQHGYYVQSGDELILKRFYINSESSNDHATIIIPNLDEISGLSAEQRVRVYTDYAVSQSDMYATMYEAPPYSYSFKNYDYKKADGTPGMWVLRQILNLTEGQFYNESQIYNYYVDANGNIDSKGCQTEKSSGYSYVPAIVVSKNYFN